MFIKALSHKLLGELSHNDQQQQKEAKRLPTFPISLLFLYLFSALLMYIFCMALSLYSDNSPSMNH